MDKKFNNHQHKGAKPISHELKRTLTQKNKVNINPPFLVNNVPDFDIMMLEIVKIIAITHEGCFRCCFFEIQIQRAR